MSEETTDKIPELKPARKVSSNAKHVFKRGLEPVNTPNKSSEQIITEMKRLAKKDLFVSE